jgi:hypothetical protein
MTGHYISHLPYSMVSRPSDVNLPLCRCFNTCRGETVAYALPEASEDFGTLGVGPTGHVDERWVGVTVLSTCDPDVLGELLERQPDFPKTWTRAPERALTRLGVQKRRQGGGSLSGCA